MDFCGQKELIHQSASIWCSSVVTALGDQLAHHLMQDAVLAITGRPEWNLTASTFDGTDWSHRKKMWIAQVVLLLKCYFRRPGEGNQRIPCTLAFVNRLWEFTVPEAGKPHVHYQSSQLEPELYCAEGPNQRRGMPILYECYPTRDLRVIPAKNIITRACLAPCFWMKCSTTTPMWHHSSPLAFYGEAEFRKRTDR